MPFSEKGHTLGGVPVIFSHNLGGSSQFEHDWGGWTKFQSVRGELNQCWNV